MRTADEALRQLALMVDRLDPDCRYDDWFRILAAIHHETGGSDEGFALVNEWSRRGSKYCGEPELRSKWRSFNEYTGRPVTVRTIRALLNKQGDDWVEICAAAEPDFEVCEREVAPPTPEPPVTVMTLLTAFSLLGKLKKLKQEMVAQVHLLGELALMGQATVMYAATNTGKTLLVLWLLIEAIKQGRVDPRLVFYINCDDNLRGLVEKLHLADTYGFHMVAEGYEGFSAQDFLRILIEVTDKGQTHGVVLILDTAKKFVDLMDKRLSTEFGKVIRRFVLRGGTVVLLAHTNKKPGPDGRPVYGGTADLLQDVDAGYTAQVVSEPGAAEKVVEFENIKRRGDIAQRAVYAYRADGSYDQMLASVRRIADAEVTELNVAAEIRADAEAVDAVCDLIRSGTNTREALVAGVMTRARWSRSSARALLDRYCGDDPRRHQWAFDVRARGAKVYRLHDIVEPRPETEPNTGLGG